MQLGMAQRLREEDLRLELRVDLRAEDFFAELLLPLAELLCAVEEPLRVVRRCALEELLFFALLFFALDFLAEDFFRGTFAPSRRASDRPIAIACLRLVTFFPLRPLFNLPRFISCISSFTFAPAFGLYRLPPEDFLAELFFVAIQNSPFVYWEAKRDVQVARGNAVPPPARYSESNPAMFPVASNKMEQRNGCLANCSSGRQDVFDIHPLRRILARVTGHAVVIAFAAIARFL